jgi:hypothetical protein
LLDSERNLKSKSTIYNCQTARAGPLVTLPLFVLKPIN